MMCSRRPEADRERHLLLQIACSLYARDLLSLGKAAELAGIETVDFARKLGSRGIARHYTEAELAADAAYARGE
jgi:predicted HTH domain antitoxin